MKHPTSVHWLRRLAALQIGLGCLGLAITVTLAILFEIASGNALDAAASAIDSTSKELEQVHQAVDDRRALLDKQATTLHALGKQFLSHRESTLDTINSAVHMLHEVRPTVAAIDKTLRTIGSHLDIEVPHSIDSHLRIVWAHPFGPVREDLDSFAGQAASVQIFMAQAEGGLSAASHTTTLFFDNVGDTLPDVEKTFADLRQHDLTSLGDNLETTRRNMVAFSADLRSLKLVVLCATALLVVLSLLFICNGMSFRFIAKVANSLSLAGIVPQDASPLTPSTTDVEFTSDALIR